MAPGRPRRLLAALVAGAPQHLLVLLLAHALTALLDQRSHEAHTLADRGRHATPEAAGPSWILESGCNHRPWSALSWVNQAILAI